VSCAVAARLKAGNKGTQQRHATKARNKGTQQRHATKARNNARYMSARFGKQKSGPICRPLFFCALIDAAAP
jgi:hypothetical protein